LEVDHEAVFSQASHRPQRFTAEGFPPRRCSRAALPERDHGLPGRQSRQVLSAGVHVPGQQLHTAGRTEILLRQAGLIPQMSQWFVKYWYVLPIFPLTFWLLLKLIRLMRS
jgi:hypothetical protein